MATTTTPDGSLIRLEALTKVFTTDEVETHALSGIHLRIDRGEYVAIAGPSGCGKSTLLSILGLLDSPSGGSYLLNGRPVQDIGARERARIRNREIGFIFQSFNLIGDLTVYENVELPLTYRGMRAAERKTRVHDALEKVGMAHRADSGASGLAHGEKRKVEIAMLIAMEPKVILLDEPMAGVGSADVPALTEVIRGLHRGGRTVLMVEHHMDVVLGLADRVAVMHHGELLAADSPEAVMANPTVQSAYLGTAA